METKFTTGKWVITHNLSEDRAIISGDSWKNFAEIIIKMKENPYFDEEGIANAKLIAAAPDLLEMCVKCLIHFEISNTEKDLQFDLKNVIKKATT